jgi:hypothetical protein
MLKAIAAGLVLAILPPPQVGQMKLEKACIRGMCMVPEKDLMMLIQSNANGVEAAKQCRKSNEI